jgi:hypothetical protein
MWITLSGEGYLSVASFLSNLNIRVSALVSSAFLCPLSTCTTLGHERRPDQSSVAAHICFKAPERSSDPKPRSSKTIACIGSGRSTQTLMDALIR